MIPTKDELERLDKIVKFWIEDTKDDCETNNAWAFKTIENIIEILLDRHKSPPKPDTEFLHDIGISPETGLGDITLK